MSYHFSKQLRVCAETLQRPSVQQSLSNARVIILQHALDDIVEYLRLITGAGATIHAFVVKPFTVDREALKRLHADGYNIVHKATYDELEESGALEDALATAIEASKRDGKRIVILEVGGYFAGPLSRLASNPLFEQDATLIAGVVEDTTFGHNRYTLARKQIEVPMHSVARSSLKEIEARVVGNMAIAATEQILREQGISMPGRRALVIGYGMIGKNLARSARAMDMTVSVYDRADNRNLRAFALGYRIHKKVELLDQADIIFAATGTPDGMPALSYGDIFDHCRQNVVLVSAGSKNTEFDVAGIEAHSEDKVEVGPHLTRYVLPNSNAVYLMNRGTAVNFIVRSVATEVMDLVFAEITEGAVLLLDGKFRERHVIHQTPQEIVDRIAHDWLKSVNY